MDIQKEVMRMVERYAAVDPRPDAWLVAMLREDEVRRLASIHADKCASIWPVNDWKA
ncbi:hypothetical protein [Paenibacillus sp. PL2-23]|uniref:hypothetical protein n=1 Tax=Paenibacillus sp. PL2-23 TaxID=2100729 RepID=UPI0030F4C7AF